MPEADAGSPGASAATGAARRPHEQGQACCLGASVEVGGSSNEAEVNDQFWGQLQGGNI